MTILNKIIIWLDGKKAIIAGCIAVIISYLASTNAMDAKLAATILAIINILFGGVKVISDVAVKGNSNLGMSIKDKRLIIK